MEHFREMRDARYIFNLCMNFIYSSCDRTVSIDNQPSRKIHTFLDDCRGDSSNYGDVEMEEKEKRFEVVLVMVVVVMVEG